MKKMKKNFMLGLCAGALSLFCVTGVGMVNANAEVSETAGEVSVSSLTMVQSAAAFIGDAAAALVGLNRLWNLGLDEDALERIGLTIGADVPFCIRGGLQRAQGVGERLTKVPLHHELYLVAFQPCLGLSTKEVFTSLHEDGILDSDRPDNEAAQSALMRGDVDALGRAMGNVLEPVSRRMRPQLDAAIRAIEESGACGARMTGSGSAVFGVYRHAGACKKAAEELKKTYPTCRMMKTAECGVVIEEV